MKTVVIFYSLEGNTKYLSEIIAKELRADLIELKTKKAYPSEGFKKYFWGGKSVVFREHPKLINENIDLRAYQNIVIGTPIWAGTYVAPFNTFVKQYKFAGKKVALFACHASNNSGKCFKMFKEALTENQFIGETDFVDPINGCKEENYKKAIEWAKSLNF